MQESRKIPIPLLCITTIVCAPLFTEIAIARFYDPGLGDPYKNSQVNMEYKIERRLPAPRQNQKITYRVNQKTMHKFAQRARALALPPDRNIEFNRGQKVYNDYILFLNPTHYAKEFRKEKLFLETIPAIQKNPNPAADIRSQDRVYALFDIIEGRFRKAATKLWQLANIPTSSKDHRTRDALFSAIASQLAGWESASFMAYNYSLSIGLDESYTNTLLEYVSTLKNEYFLSSITDKISDASIAKLEKNKAIDPALFAIAKNRFAANEEGLDSIEKKLSENSSVSEKMQLLKALAYIENKKHKAALQILKNLSLTSDHEINEKARVNLARLMAIFSQHDQALKIYRTISFESLVRLDSLLEIAWLEFENGDYPYSLGKSIGLQTQFFQHAFLPEIYVLEAYNRKNMCDFGGARVAMNQFKKDYKKEIFELRALVTRKNKNKDFSMYEKIKNDYRSEQIAKTKIPRFERFLLQVPEISNYQKTLFALQKEYQSIVKEPIRDKMNDNREFIANRGFLALSLEKFYRKTKQEYAPLLEQLVYDELKYLDRKLLALFQQVDLIHLDIAASADMNHTMQSALNFPTLPEGKEEKLRAEQTRWPFEDNEFWADEVAWLKVKNPSKCVPKSNDQPESQPLAGMQ